MHRTIVDYYIVVEEAGIEILDDGTKLVTFSAEVNRSTNMPKDLKYTSASSEYVRER